MTIDSIPTPPPLTTTNPTPTTWQNSLTHLHHNPVTLLRHSFNLQTAKTTILLASNPQQLHILVLTPTCSSIINFLHSHAQPKELSES